MKQISKPPLFVSCALAMGNCALSSARKCVLGKGEQSGFEMHPRQAGGPASPAQRLQPVVAGHQGTAVQTLFVMSESEGWAPL